MKTVFLTIISIVVALSCSTQKVSNTSKEVNYIPYYLKVYEADSLYIVGNYQRSYEILDSLFKKYEPINFMGYNEYAIYVQSSYLINQKKGIAKKVEKLIAAYGYTKEWFTYDSTSVLSKVYQTANISEENYQILRQRYLSSIDLELREQVVNMIENDQYYRRFYDKEDIEIKRNETDSIIEQILIKWFDKGIYPNMKKIGNGSVDEKRSLDIVVLLLHTKKDIRSSYFTPKIYEFVKKGECSPQTYAVIVDQLNYYQYKENDAMLYGEFNLRNIDSTQYYKFNPKRNEIGLPTLEYTKWRIRKISSNNY